MSAIFINGVIATTEGRIPAPFIYFNEYSSTQPPFSVSDSAGSKYVTASQTVYQSVTLGTINDDSGFWIVKNGAFVGRWTAITSDHNEHLIYTLSNGYKIYAKNDDDWMVNIIIKDSNDTTLVQPSSPLFGQKYACIAVLQDEVSGLYIPALVQIYSNSPSYWSWNMSSSGVIQSNFALGNQLFANTIVPAITWLPFERLAGNDGQFQMDLTTIDASIIGDGETITFVTDNTKVNVIQRTNLYNLAVNMLDGQEYTIAYCGDNYLTMKRRTDVIAAGTDIYITLKFYFRSDTAIFTSGEYRLRMVGDYPHVTYWLSMIYDEENEVAAPLLLGGTWYVASDSWNYTFGGESLPSNEQMRALYIWLQDNGNAQSNTPYGTGTTDNGGDPEGDRQQDHITTPSLPSCGGLDLGLVTLYRPDAGQLASIAAFLWSDNVLDNFKKYFNNFADNILSLYSLPFTPSGLPTKTFTVGKMTSSVTGVEYCTTRFFDIDMGQVEIKNKWGSYLDYSPYTKIEIYLPYLGNHTLDTDELMSPARMDGSMPDKQGTVLSLVYRLDILTGVIVALIKVRVYTKTGGYTDEIRYQFSGKVGSTTPLTGATYANMVNAILSAGAGLATTIATGGLTAPLTAAAAVTGTVQASKPNVERIGAISGDASMLATNVPYVCISVPNKPFLDQQEIYTGFPSYKSGTLGSFEGFTQVIEAHVEGISCTEEERTLILKWLKEGVII